MLSVKVHPMPRGFRKDINLTALAHEGLYGQLLVDSRSFWSIDGHILAYGKDKEPIRAEIFRLNREANGGVNRCWNCGVMVEEHEGDHMAANGEWDHIYTKRRCDCTHNGRVSCPKCHRDRHVQVKWSKP